MKQSVKTYLQGLRTRHQLTPEALERHLGRVEQAYRETGILETYRALTLQQVCMQLQESIPQGYTYHTVFDGGIYHDLVLVKPAEQQEAELAALLAKTSEDLEAQTEAAIQSELDAFIAGEEAEALEAALQKERDRIAQLKADLFAELSKP